MKAPSIIIRPGVLKFIVKLPAKSFRPLSPLLSGINFRTVLKVLMQMVLKVSGCIEDLILQQTQKREEIVVPDSTPTWT